MSTLKEIIPGSNLLDEELSAIRGGAGDVFVAICKIGEKDGLKCDTGEIPVTGNGDIDACM